MFTGKVNALYARMHHRKWYDRKMQEEEDWEESVMEEGRKAKASEIGMAD